MKQQEKGINECIIVHEPPSRFLSYTFSYVTISDCETLILDKDNQMNEKKHFSNDDFIY